MANFTPSSSSVLLLVIIFLLACLLPHYTINAQSSDEVRVEATPTALIGPQYSYANGIFICQRPRCFDPNSSKLEELILDVKTSSVGQLHAVNITFFDRTIYNTTSYTTMIPDFVSNQENKITLINMPMLGKGQGLAFILTGRWTVSATARSTAQATIIIGDNMKVGQTFVYSFLPSASVTKSNANLPYFHRIAAPIDQPQTQNHDVFDIRLRNIANPANRWWIRPFGGLVLNPTDFSQKTVNCTINGILADLDLQQRADNMPLYSFIATLPAEYDTRELSGGIDFVLRCEGIKLISTTIPFGLIVQFIPSNTKQIDWENAPQYTVSSIDPKKPLTTATSIFHYSNAQWQTLLKPSLLDTLHSGVFQETKHKNSRYYSQYRYYFRLATKNMRTSQDITYTIELDNVNDLDVVDDSLRYYFAGNHKEFSTDVFPQVAQYGRVKQITKKSQQQQQQQSKFEFYPFSPQFFDTQVQDLDTHGGGYLMVEVMLEHRNGKESKNNFLPPTIVLSVSQPNPSYPRGIIVQQQQQDDVNYIDYSNPLAITTTQQQNDNSNNNQQQQQQQQLQQSNYTPQRVSFTIASSLALIYTPSVNSLDSIQFSTKEKNIMLPSSRSFSTYSFNLTITPAITARALGLDIALREYEFRIPHLEDEFQGCIINGKDVVPITLWDGTRLTQDKNSQALFFRYNFLKDMTYTINCGGNVLLWPTLAARLYSIGTSKHIVGSKQKIPMHVFLYTDSELKQGGWCYRYLTVPIENHTMAYVLAAVCVFVVFMVLSLVGYYCFYLRWKQKREQQRIAREEAAAAAQQSDTIDPMMAFGDGSYHPLM